MIKKFCDRCGLEINDNDIHYEYVVGKINYKDKKNRWYQQVLRSELCEKCSDVVKKVVLNEL